MNKNIKNALLLSAVMSVGGAWATSPYDDTQFGDTGGTLTRKASGKFDAFSRDAGWTKPSDADAARQTYKDSFDARVAQNDADIAHLEGQRQDPNAVPGLVVIKAKAKDGQDSGIDNGAGGTFTWGEVKAANAAKQQAVLDHNAAINARIALLEEAKRKKEDLKKAADSVTHKSRAEVRREAFDATFGGDLARYRALAETLPEGMDDADAHKLFQGVAKIQPSDVVTNAEHEKVKKALAREEKNSEFLVDQYDVLANLLKGVYSTLDIGNTDAVEAALKALIAAKAGGSGGSKPTLPTEFANAAEKQKYLDEVDAHRKKAEGVAVKAAAATGGAGTPPPVTRTASGKGFLDIHNKRHDSEDAARAASQPVKKSLPAGAWIDGDEVKDSEGTVIGKAADFS